MKRVFLPVLLGLLLLAGPLWAQRQYRLYLKSGATIEGITEYEETATHVRFRLHGGEVAIPLEDVLRIEAYTAEEPAEAPPAPPAQEPEAPEPPAREAAQQAELRRLKDWLKKIDERLKEVQDKEEELKALKEELRRVRLRIELKYKQGRERCQQVLAQQGVPAPERTVQCRRRYLQFLSPRDRGIVQSNFIRKAELEAAIAELEEVLSPLLQDKEELLKERAQVLQSIRELRSGSGP